MTGISRKVGCARRRKVGGAKRRKTVCWSRMSKKGRYVVCNRSKGQKTMRKKKGKIKRKRRVKKVRRGKRVLYV